MAKISVRTIDDAPVAPLPAGWTGGAVTCHGIFAGERDPLHLHRLDLAAHGWLECTDAGRGRIIFVRNGAVETNDVRLDAGSSITIEHRAGLRITATEESRLILFGQSMAGTSAERGTGGQVHLLPSERVARKQSFEGFEYTGGALFADAQCDSCGLWLHETILNDHGVELHSHNEDEIIVMLKGEIMLGNRRAGAGVAISVAHGTLYGFDVGPDEVIFINFRAGSPTFSSGDGSMQNVDEGAFFVKHVGHPDLISFASKPGVAPASA